ncbi:transforming growth factor beta activator LRRC32-like [Bradysia coprophila]|uniref:transforming growth factor beta activator LRRC32-like n=1 Tax=Bradysia coprophila TaxID=38358 RepID=UPI00187DC398|nr:transforming growth factor beta activator LRRC32-like [Bradysia coprophila]
MNSIICWCFSLTLCILHIVVVRADICDLCSCDGEESETVLRIKCLTETKLGLNVDLENIQWPTINKSVEAHFNDLQFDHLPKLLGSATVKAINLDHNLIETIKSDPFKQCKNLKSLSIANNSIHDLPKDFLKSTHLLRHLNLSHNSLSDIDSGVLSHLTSLRSIDLSYNKLKTLSVGIVDTLDNVEILNLEGNDIIFIQIPERRTLPVLRNLNLASNKLSLVGVATLQYFGNLETLDLSNNSIEVIEADSFTQLTKLKYLDISNNALNHLSLALPDVIEHLTLSSNHLNSWPLVNFPATLIHIEIQNNKLTELFSTKWFSNNLKSLNVSHNFIEFLPYVEYAQLEILDLSFNAFTTVPQNLGAKAPRLDTLILDHNPIEIVDFVDPIYLRKLSLKNMSLLQDVSAAALRNVDGQDDCMEVVISHCEKLSNIDRNAMRHLDLCYLDLSYNNLSSIPELLTNWTRLTEGIDLQGNPFECSCSEQWMLDVILQQLYLNESQQHLLYNLKCNGPEDFKGQRFVKYYKKRAAFCNPNSAMRMASTEDQIQLSSFERSLGNIHLSLTAGPGCIIVIVLSAICMILLVIVAFRWRKQQRERIERQRILQYYDYIEYE